MSKGKKKSELKKRLSELLPVLGLSEKIPINMPEDIKKCLLQHPQFSDFSTDYLFIKTEEGKIQSKRIGKYLQKTCPDTLPEYQKWKSKQDIGDALIKAILLAHEKQQTSSEGTILKSFNGTYAVPKNPNYEIIISQDAINILQKSAGQLWERESCERVAGSFGSPETWLKTGENCGFCSDIEHGNLVLFIKNKKTGKIEGRQMLRWCEDSKGNKKLGVEKRWYGARNIPSNVMKYKTELLKELGEKTGIDVTYKGSCKTPYIYGGYSDQMAKGNTQITYYGLSEGFEETRRKMPHWGEFVLDHLGEDLYLWNVGKREYRIDKLEKITIPSEFRDVDDLIDFLYIIDYYQHHTFDLEDIADDVISDYIYTDESNTYLRDEEELDERIEEWGWKFEKNAEEKARKLLEKDKTVIISSYGQPVSEDEIGEAYETVREYLDDIICGWTDAAEGERSLHVAEMRSGYFGRDMTDWEKKMRELM